MAVPVLRVLDCYLVSLTGGLSDTAILDLQRSLLERLWNEQALGLVIDVSALDLIDSYMARVFDDLGLAVSAMGARTILVGLRPEIAITLVEMGIELKHIQVALNTDNALKMLHQQSSLQSQSKSSKLATLFNDKGRDQATLRQQQSLKNIQRALAHKRASILQSLRRSGHPFEPESVEDERR